MSNLSQVSTYELRVAFLSHANAVVRYAAQYDDGVQMAKTREEQDHGWYVVDVTCSAREHVILLAFIDGLEYAYSNL